MPSAIVDDCLTTGRNNTYIILRRSRTTYELSSTSTTGRAYLPIRTFEQLCKAVPRQSMVGVRSAIVDDRRTAGYGTQICTYKRLESYYQRWPSSQANLPTKSPKKSAWRRGSYLRVCVHAQPGVGPPASRTVCQRVHVAHYCIFKANLRNKRGVRATVLSRSLNPTTRSGEAFASFIHDEGGTQNGDFSRV